MRDDRIYGAALIAGAVAFLGTAGLHPTGSQLLASPEAFARHAPSNVFAHALALFSVWLTLFGIVGLARRLGPQRPGVIAAFVAFALASAMVSVAAIVDGLVSTRLAAVYVASGDDAERATLKGSMRFCYYLASSSTRYYVTAASVAVLLWSWAAWRAKFDRVLPWLGAAIGVLALAAQTRGRLQMNVHDVMLLAVGQGIWMAWAGAALWRARAQGPLESGA
jgi:hypothetical protein